MRTFSSIDLVQLPRLDANSATTLAQEILTVAAAEASLPTPVAEALAEVDAAAKGLRAAGVKDIKAQVKEVTPASRAADNVIDACWAGLSLWLQGWAKMPGLEEAEAARSMHAKLFPNGLKFTQLRFKLEWAESRTRLELVKADKLDAAIKELGGAKILKRLRDAHEAYGDALGITVVGPETEAPGVRDALEATVEALRDYVVQASASARKKDPSTAALRDRLLAPIARWESVAASSPAEPDPEPVAPPPEEGEAQPEPVARS